MEDSREEIEENNSVENEDSHVDISDNGSDEESYEDFLKSKRNRKRRLETELDDDDLDLVEENLGVKLNRDVKLTRLKKKKKVSETNAPTANGYEELEKELFAEDDLFSDKEHSEDEVIEKPKKDDVDEFDFDIEEENDDMRDFIEDDVDQNVLDRQDYATTRGVSGGAQSLFEDDDALFGEPFFSDEESEKEEKTAEEKEEVPEMLSSDISRLNKMKQVYEPSTLKEQYFTEEDYEIKLADLPERHQLRQRRMTVSVETDENELDEEALFIYNKLFAISSLEERNAAEKELFLKKIRQVLVYFSVENLEVPFVVLYRQEYYQPELNAGDLWAIWDEDEKWQRFKGMRAKLSELKVEVDDVNESMKSELETDLSVRISEVETCFSLLASSAHMLDTSFSDMASLLNLSLASFDKKRPQSSKKNLIRAHKLSLYPKCFEHLRAAADAIGPRPSELGQNMDVSAQINQIKHFEMTPSEFATDYLCASFSTEDSVLRGIKYLLSVEFAHDPCIRQVVRTMYQTYLVVSTTPTAKGKAEMDMFHPFAHTCYLAGKPLSSFSGVLFLEVVQAEQLGLITVDFALPSAGMEGEQEVKELFRTWASLVEETAVDENSMMWNEFRRDVLDQALQVHLPPLLIKETRSQLLEHSKKALIDIFASQIRSLISIQPYTPAKESARVDCSTSVVAIIQPDSERDPFEVVYVSPTGEVVDHLSLHFLSTFVHQDSSSLTQERAQAAQDSFLQFIDRHRPQAIVVGASSIRVRKLYDVVTAIASKMVDSHQDNGPFRMPHIAYTDPRISRIFATSSVAETAFPDYSLALRQAISLARFFQDPLMEAAALCNSNRDVLLLPLHPLQHMVSQDKLFEAVERVFVQIVCSVGVHVPLAIDFPHKAYTLQFVAGLGPRKAAHLLTKMRAAADEIERREDLVLSRLMGKVVFINSAAFLRFTEYERQGRYLSVDILDSTRVHPESYHITRVMCRDGLEEEGNLSEERLAALPSDVISDPKCLDILDLAAYAEQLEDQGAGKKQITLEFIKEELSAPFKFDPMVVRPYAPLGGPMLFSLLTHETEHTLGRGMLLSVVVTRVFPSGVSCRLDNGLNGFVKLADFSDHPVDALEERVRPGQAIHVRVLNVDMLRFSVDLTCKTSMLQADVWLRELQRPSYFDRYSEEQELHRKLTKAHEKKEDPHKRKYLSRNISHPLFQNISYQAAVDYLRDMDIGTTVFRPSSKGKDHLTVTWTMGNGHCQHIPVVEQDKSLNAEMGSALFIGDQQFDDLDEITARHIEPMAELVRELVGHKAFQEGTRGMIESHLESCYAENPARIPYAFGYGDDARGIHFVLYCYSSQQHHHSPVQITPHGYRYKHEYHTTVNRLLNFFKKSFFSSRRSQPHHHQYAQPQQAAPLDNWNAAGLGDYSVAYPQAPAEALPSDWATILAASQEHIKNQGV